jgi:hypothetical protein
VCVFFFIFYTFRCSCVRHQTRRRVCAHCVPDTHKEVRAALSITQALYCLGRLVLTTAFAAGGADKAPEDPRRGKPQNLFHTKIFCGSFRLTAIILPAASILNHCFENYNTSLIQVLEKLTGLQLVKKFPAIYRTRRFITAFTSARHLSLY